MSNALDLFVTFNFTKCIDSCTAERAISPFLLGSAIK